MATITPLSENECLDLVNETSNEVVAGYMRDISTGAIPSCRYIKLAVKRHLSDLVNAQDRGYYFDENAGQHIIDFFKFLKHSKGEWAGEVITLEPWQQFQLWVLFGWLRASDGMRRYRIAYEEVARKNGKTTKSRRRRAVPVRRGRGAGRGSLYGRHETGSSPDRASGSNADGAEVPGPFPADRGGKGTICMSWKRPASLSPWAGTRTAWTG